MDLSSLKLLPVQYITKRESLAIEHNEFANGKTAYELMKNAGNAVAEYIKSLSLKNILIICGKGNNGGDGLIVGVELSASHHVTIILMGKPKTATALKALSDFKKTGLKIQYYNIDVDLTKLETYMNDNDVIVDALFGVGLSRQISTPYSQILELLSKYDTEKHICSIDIPSGLDCDSGEWLGPTFNASSIISMQFSKRAFRIFHDEDEDLAENNKPNILIPEIGIDDKHAYIVDEGHFVNYWRKRDLNSYKGQNGRVIVVGGSDGFTGAPVLAGMATLRSGVDTLRIAVPETIRDIVAGYAEDFIVLKVGGSIITSKGFKRYKDLVVNRHDVLVMGMGISNHPDVVKFVREIFAYAKDRIRIVLDADAIRAFRGNLDLLKDSGAILTPHRAELRMMLNEEIPKGFPELVDFLQVKAKELGIIILLKGRIDVITNGERTLLNETGHPGMTVGGTGDVLAGLVASANCFVDDPLFATAIGAYIMGKAGERAAEDLGNSLLASDVIKHIPQVLLHLEQQRDSN